MYAFTHDNMQMVLSLALCGADARFEDLFRFVDVLAVEVDGVARQRGDGIVLKEDELRGLRVVGGSGRLVLFAERGEGGGFGAIIRGVGLVRLPGASQVSLLMGYSVGLGQVGSWAGLGLGWIGCENVVLL